MNHTIRNSIIAGLIAGYAITVIQVSDGPAHVFENARAWWREHMTVGHLDALADCGWCAAPYVTLPVFLAVTATLRGERRKSVQAVGYATATGIAAFLRHEADRY